MENVLSQFLLGHKPLDADLGVEIEVEGRNLPNLYNIPGILKKWRLEQDGSLRAGIELVLGRPVKFNKLEKILLDLEKGMKENDIRLATSDRTGTHLHLNVGDLTPIDLVKFLCLYYIIEEPLVDLCGNNRIGNHFCLRAIDADYVVTRIIHSLERNRFSDLREDIIRYSALNLCALHRYSSLEFRAIQTTPNFVADIIKIATVLMELKEAIKNFELPSDILLGYSGISVSGFLSSVFPKSHVIFKDIVDLESKCRRGMLFSQEIAFCRKYDSDFTWGLRGKGFDLKKSYSLNLNSFITAMPITTTNVTNNTLIVEEETDEEEPHPFDDYEEDED